MAITISSNTAALKTVYTPEIIDFAVERYAKFLSFLSAGAATDIGNYEMWELPIKSNWSVGVTSEGGVFPTSRSGVSINPYTTLGQLVASVSWSHLLETVGKGRGAWVDVTRRETEDAMKCVVSLCDRYMAGGSGDGALATVESSTSTSTSFVAGLPFGTLLLEENMPIQIHDGSSTEREDYTTISKIVHSTRTVTVADSQNLTAADKVYISLGTSGGTKGLSTHVNGLGNLVSDSGTVHNIVRGTYEAAKAQVFSNGGELRNYSDELVHSALALTETRSKADARIDYLLSNKGQLKKFNDSLRPDRRIAVDGSGLNTTGTGVNLKPAFYYGDRAIPWLEFNHIKPRTIYGIVKKNFKRYGEARPKWMDGFELGISSNARTTSKEVFLVWPTQLVARKFNDMFAITDLSDPVHCGADVNGTDA